MVAWRVADEVASALAAGRGVVALESTLIAHGLPRPGNLAAAGEIEEAVRAAGAVPATIAVLDGVAVVGLDAGQVERLATNEMAKLSQRDLPLAAARGTSGATTVAATAHLATLAGITVFATGGLGGVHRGARETWDESADLAALATTPVIVVCSGVKSILDVPATLERLETLGVPVAACGSDRFPGFYLADAAIDAPARLDSPEEVAAAWRAARALGLGGRGMVVANPLPPEEQLDPALHDRVLADALAAAAAHGVTGKAVTPFLLERFHGATAGRSLTVNIRLVVRNAALAARIAVALTR